MKTAINLKHCKGCNICVYICPKKCYSKGTELSPRGYFAAVVSAPENCYNHKKDDNPICELCILSCPDQAISWTPEGKEERQA